MVFFKNRQPIRNALNFIIMCRLLGIYGQIDFWQDIVMEFRKQAEFGKIPPIENLKTGHKDGWGMTMSNRDTAGMVEVKRQLGSAYESTTYREVVYSFKTTPRVFLCHLRQASENIPIALSNVHPFFVNEWAFIHNGTVFDAESLPRDSSLMLTSDGSDSEHLFHLTHKWHLTIFLCLKSQLLRSSLNIQH